MGAALQTQGDYKGFGSVLMYSFSSTSVPQWLRDIPRWLCWKAEPKPGAPGKFGKVPVNPRTGATIGHNNPENHMTFDQALVEFAFAGPKAAIAGIGLSIPEGVAVIDLDNMIKDDGLISCEHREILETFKDSYTEFSPSGAGAHIFVRGSARTFAKHDLGIELYSITEGKGGQYMTVTGMTYQGRSGPDDGGPDCSDALLALCDRYGAKVKSMSGRPLPPIPAPEDVARTPEQLEIEGVIRSGVARDDRALAPPPSGSLRLITKYGRRPNFGERAGPGGLVVQRFKALSAAAFYLARCGVPLWEAFSILSNSDYKLSEGAYDGRSGETWLWQYCFCSELEDGTRAVDVFASQAVRASGELPFDDLSETEPGHWHNTDSVPKTSNSKERRIFTAQVIDASNVQDFTSRSLPPRPWLVKPLLLKGYVTVCLGPPGGGKSIFSMLLAVSLVSGLDLTGVGAPEAVCNVLVINNEDDGDEMQRRFQGVLLAHGIDQSKLRGKIYWQSGYERSYKLARGEGKEKTPAATEDAHEIARFCRDHDIGAVFMDPLVSLHDTNENDNAAIEKVAEIVRTVSANSGAAVHLVAHIRKQVARTQRGTQASLEAARCELDGWRGARSLYGRKDVRQTRQGAQTRAPAGVEPDAHRPGEEQLQPQG